MNLSALCEKLILAGADAIREEGREEVRQEFAAQRQREMELDDLAVRLTSDKQVSTERVSVQFLLMETLRQAVNQHYCATLRDTANRCFACVITGLSASEAETLRSLSADLMATVEERHRHERQERTGRS